MRIRLEPANRLPACRARPAGINSRINLPTMTAIALSAKGQATIPKPIRDLLGLKPGGRVTFEVRGEEVVLRAVGNPAGMLSRYARLKHRRSEPRSVGRHLAAEDGRSHAA